MPALGANRNAGEGASLTGLSLRGQARWRGFDVVWYAVERADWRS